MIFFKNTKQFTNKFFLFPKIIDASHMRSAKSWSHLLDYLYFKGLFTHEVITISKISLPPSYGTANDRQELV